MKRYRQLLLDLDRWLAGEGVAYLVIGGVAASLLGRPRFTGDVDAMVLLHDRDLGSFLQSGAKFGFAPRIADAVAFAEQARVLLLRYGTESLQVDLALGWLPFEESAVERGEVRLLEGVEVHVPSPEDLVVMKIVAGRVKDHEDISGIFEANAKLDIDYISSRVAGFAELLEAPEFTVALDRLLASYGR
ncbi:MAG: nucleotidyltransferase [Actinomycetota bacterium]